MLIDLSNDFYIVKLLRKKEYDRALLDGPWMIGENYLHVQRWKSNFRADKAEISSLPVWIRFHVLPVEYYTESWLQRARNQIGRTIKVDLVTLIASRGKFAKVCVDVDPSKPLKLAYRTRPEHWKLQYEGLHEICFYCGRYGHWDSKCPNKLQEKTCEVRRQMTQTLKKRGMLQGLKLKRRQQKEDTAPGWWCSGADGERSTLRRVVWGIRRPLCSA